MTEQICDSTLGTARCRYKLGHPGQHGDGTYWWESVDLCEWCKHPADAPGSNSRGETCPCRCHPALAGRRENLVTLTADDQEGK